MKKCSKPITVEGVTYESIREACDYYKLNYKKVNETPQFTPTFIMISWAMLSSLTT